MTQIGGLGPHLYRFGVRHLAGSPPKHVHLWGSIARLEKIAERIQLNGKVALRLFYRFIELFYLLRPSLLRNRAWQMLGSDAVFWSE